MHPDLRYAAMIGGAVLIALIALGALLLLLLAWLGVRAQKARVATGAEEIVGRRGEARSRLNPKGTVFVRGELWRARARAGETMNAGEQVEVVGVEGLTLLVRRAPDDARP